jgi:hypothetical protein
MVQVPQATTSVLGKATKPCQRSACSVLEYFWLPGCSVIEAGCQVRLCNIDSHILQGMTHKTRGSQVSFISLTMASVVDVLDKEPSEQSLTRRQCIVMAKAIPEIHDKKPSPGQPPYKQYVRSLLRVALELNIVFSTNVVTYLNLTSHHRLRLFCAPFSSWSESTTPWWDRRFGLCFITQIQSRCSCLIEFVLCSYN